MGRAGDRSFLLLCLISLSCEALRKWPLTSSISDSNVASVAPLTSTLRQQPREATAPTVAFKRPAKRKTQFPPEKGRRVRAAERAGNIWSVPSGLNLELTAQGGTYLQALTVSPPVAVRYWQSWKMVTSFVISKTSALPKALAQTAVDTCPLQLLDLAFFEGILPPTARCNWVLKVVSQPFILPFVNSSVEQLLFPTLMTSAMSDFLESLLAFLGSSFSKLHLYRLRHNEASSAIALGYLSRKEVIRRGKASRLVQIMTSLPEKSSQSFTAPEQR